MRVFVAAVFVALLAGCASAALESVPGGAALGSAPAVVR